MGGAGIVVRCVGVWVGFRPAPAAAPDGSGRRSCCRSAGHGSRMKKVPSQGMRGTFKNCQGLLLAESMRAESCFASTS